MELDFYKVLEVSESATQEEISAAYKRLVRLYHPDINKNVDASKIKNITQAYDVLSDSEKRRRYDQSRKAGSGFSFHQNASDAGFAGFSGGFSGGGFFSDIEEIITGFRRGSGSNAIQGSDIVLEIEIQLSDAFTGKHKEITYEVEEPCRSCICNECKGAGIKLSGETFFGMQYSTSCPTCKGAGSTGNKKGCGKCNGKMKIMQKKNIVIDIPAGIKNNQSMQMKGKGNFGLNGAGDLIVTIHIAPHARFKTSELNYDLHTEISISFIDLLLGTQIFLKGIDDENLSINIKECHGFSSPILLKGKGMRVLNKNVRGDLHIILQAQTPSYLTSEQREALKSIKTIFKSNSESGFFF